MNLGKMTPERTFALLLWDVGRQLRKAVDARASEAGLTSAQWHLMSTLARCEKLNQALPNQANLADLLEIEPITLSRQIDRLTTLGLIERLPHPTDRRAHLLRLTEKAWPVVLKFKDIATEVLRDAMSGVPATEIDRMIVALERIRANLSGKADAVPESAPRAKTRNKEGISA